MDLRIKNAKAYIDGAFRMTDLYIDKGRIRHITNERLHAESVYDAEGDLVIPGLVDPHVHISLEVGSHKSADDFRTGSLAAAFGGVTTIIDFLDPVDNTCDFEKEFARRRNLAKESLVDYAFHATIKDLREDPETFVEAIRKKGIVTLKLFTTYSETDRRTKDKTIKRLLPLSKDRRFLPLAHIEADRLIRLDEAFTHEDLPTSRPARSETEEALKLARLVEETGGYLYMVHLSSGKTLERLKELHPTLLGKHFFIESCPQYFAFDEDKLKGGEGKLFTFAPPLRTNKEQELLHARFSHVDTIGTDHCPFLREEKMRAERLSAMPLGIGGVEHAFDVMYHYFGMEAIERMSVRPAKIHGLFPKKGAIREGSDADLFVYKLEKGKIDTFHGGSDHTVYEGHPRKGRLRTTISKGRFVVRDGKAKETQGEYLEREAPLWRKH